MKKELLIASALVGFAACAADTTVETSNTMCFVPVAQEMKSATGMFLVTAPFADYDSGDIKVADVISTANLSNGDKLLIPTATGDYDGYTLQDGTWTPDKKCTLTADGEIVVGTADAASDARIARGKAFWVKTSAAQLNLFGNAVSEAVTVSVAGGSKLNWALVGATLPTTEIAVASVPAGNKGDTLVLANGTQYICNKNGAWVTYDNPSTATTDKIPAGVGFWIATTKGISLTNL